MHDSLFSRFRSGLLGAVLSEVLLAQGFQHSTRLDAAATDSSGNLVLAPASHRLLTQIQTWLQTEPKQGLTLLPNCSDLPAPPSELALMLVPVMIFYHDQPLPLQAILRQWADQSQLADSTALAMGVVGQTVSLILRDRMVPLNLIPQLLRDLDWLSDSVLAPGLEQVQIWLEQSTSLVEVAQAFRQIAARKQAGIKQADLTWLLALYSFLSTPDQCQLTLARLARLPGYQPGDAALAGLWSGLYGGLTGIPLVWRQQLGMLSTKFSALPSERELFHNADQLLAVWSGTAQLQQWFQVPHHANLIASPRTIR